MDDLVTWLRAQLDEDERDARAATDGPWRMDGMSVRGETSFNRTDVLVIRHTWPQEAAHIARHDPARMLREVEAKRTIVGYGGHFMRGAARSPDDDVMRGNANAYRVVLRLLASTYADRPGYRDDWKPTG